MKIFASGGKLHWVKNLWQRYTMGAGCCDLFNYREYISAKLAIDLKVFKDKGMSFPMRYTFDEWQDILREMIDGFEAVETLNYEMPDFKSKRERELIRKQERALKLFKENFHDLWI